MIVRAELLNRFVSPYLLSTLFLHIFLPYAQSSFSEVPL
jgi:hypothetical protein